MVPTDVIGHIFTFLSVSSLNKVSLVNKEWYNVSKLDHLWKKLYSAAFGRHGNEDTGYKRQYGERRKLEWNWLHCKFKQTDIPLPNTMKLSFVTISNDLIINGSMNGLITAYDMRSKQIVKQFIGHKSFVTCMLTTDSSLISSSNDKTIRIWNMDTEKEALQIQTDFPIIFLCYCQKTNTLIGSYRSNNFIDLWSMETGKVTSRIHLTNPPSCMTFDGSVLWIGIGKNLVMVDLETRNQRQIKSAHIGVISCIRARRDLDLVVSGGNDGSMVLWNKSGELTSWHIRTQMIKDIAICPLRTDLVIIASAGRDKSIQLYNGMVDKYIGSVISTHTDEMNNLLFHQDRLYSFSDKKGVCLGF
jgi:WD40 repeat protein